MTLQDFLYLNDKLTPKNHPASLGLNADSLYITQAYKTAEIVRDAVLDQLEIISNKFNSISELTQKLLDQVPVDSLGTELVQFGVSPTADHICYFAFSYSDDLFRLTVQDIQTGVITVTGKTLEQLKANIPGALESFYKIPLHPG
ncbi:hypothetical protein J7438_27545, partial [Thalassotalea sp. G20_0]|uniref:hypothetical protein n=1 Tax=Thalassotalea sp. G20_0 TaxID=2821093 RepID=UPI001AD9C117